MRGRGYPSLRTDFTCLTGQLSPAGITRTFPPTPISACELTSSSMGMAERSVFGLPVEREVEVAREDLPSRAVVQFDDVALGVGSDLHRISWFGFGRYAAISQASQ
jgi:hypothetical protein